MNRSQLPQAPIASRFQSFFAAVAVTLTMLAGIDTLAVSESAHPMLARSSVVAQHA